MSHANDPLPSCDAHDAPHRPIASQLLADDWMLAYEATEDGAHTQFALLFAEASREVVACFAGEPSDPSEVGYGSDAVLEVVAHTVWHLANQVPPGDCDGGRS